MLKNVSGFSLMEMLIAMAILGLLAVVLTPVIRGLMPDQNKVMIKRSYYIITNTVDKMISDETLYSPFGAVGTANETTPIYKDKLFYNTDKVVYNGVEYKGSTKFAKLFLDIIGGKNLTEGTDKIYFYYDTLGSNYSSNAREYVSAQTKDGIKWTIFKGGVGWDGHTTAAFIKVDVNGDKGPNCFQGSSACNGRTKDFDQYVVGVYQDGVVQTDFKSSWVRSILSATSSVNN